MKGDHLTEEEKKLTKFEKRIRSKLTKDEWRKLKEKIKIREEILSFRKEFRKQIYSFITGAFAFVAALVWRDAIQSILDRIIKKTYIPVHKEWLVKLITAILISFIAVVAIVIISRVLRVNEKNSRTNIDED